MTPLLLTKLLRDLRATWDRIALMTLALCITLVMFSGVLYTWGVISRELPRAYVSTNPASATILLDRALDAGQIFQHNPCFEFWLEGSSPWHCASPFLD
ncbi:MAG: hypothetical protein C4583_03525 [Anaerolineaceae bacterium]|nr:MAG: hypothetical protein C4583_03525 [Anaerolineaceae bacterium]